MHAPHPFSDRFTKNRGFALIVTLSLMILLTVIAVGLLSLSSITLRGTSASSARQTAQANARMAMMLAIGQLQKYAGPDQRITATADIAGGAGGIAVADGAAPLNKTSLDGTDKGLSSVQPGTRHWTGVWKNRDPASSIYTKTPSPLLLQWLVSGNEAFANVTSSGAKTPANTEYGLSAAGGVQDLKKAVVLVSGKTEGNKNGPFSSYVSAPLVDIRGVGASASKTVGRYGWWVGDEGVKAKINLVAPYAKDELATFKNFSTQRSGWESVAGFGGYPLPVGTGNADPLSGVVSLPQVSLIGNQAIPRTSLSFHSATTDSYGVLADALQGGLRLDLTSYLRQTLPTSAPLAYPNGIASNTNIIPTAVSNTIKGPKWQALKDFSGFSSNISSGIISTKPAATVDDAAIAPTIVELRLLLGAQMVPSGTANSYYVQPCAKIAIVLANPYAFPLRWRGQGLDIEIKNSRDDAAYQNSSIGHAGATAATAGNISFGGAYVPNSPSQAAVFNKTLFRIPPGSIPVGGAVAYTIDPANTSAELIKPGSGGNNTVRLINAASLAPIDREDYTKVVRLQYTATMKSVEPNVVALFVLEANQTSQINVEMRPAAGTTILRELKELELDNSNYAPTARYFTSRSRYGINGSTIVDISGNPQEALIVEDVVGPVPLQYYSFQVSPPGQDYVNSLPPPFPPNPSSIGLRGSTLRTYADFNLQATRFRKPIISYNPPPFFMYTADSKAFFGVIRGGGKTGDKFLKELGATNLSWGRKNNLGPTETVLYCPPASGESLVSLAQFQHADLTADDVSVSVGHQPGNALGNSYATPFVKRELTSLVRQDYQIIGSDTVTPAINTNYYDISYLLNASMWDTYFFSTIPATSTIEPLNSKIVKLDPADVSADLRAGDKSSGRLLVNGAFNINSTSKDAWKAFLAGSKHLKHPADPSTVPAGALFPRSLRQKSSSVDPPSGVDADSFSGYRRLNDAQLDALAVEIVKQVRLRGPFVSLSHFVNRALVRLETSKELGRSGALQGAIDLSGANIKPDASLPADAIFPTASFTLSEDKLTLQGIGSGDNVRPRADVDSLASTGAPQEKATTFTPSNIWPAKSRDGNPGAVASILADKPMLNDNNYKSEQGFRSTGIPGWLTQADVLQVIGPSIAARSDTFKIRSYGEALDASGNVTARAWCEASVQRIPEYVDSVNQPSDRAAQLGVNTVNGIFGRRFKCTSFRWLSSDEI